MNHLQKLCAVMLVLFVVPQMAQAIKLGQVPPKVELQENLGGRLDGTAWRSDELKGKVHVLFYVDPDEKHTNNDASEATDPTAQKRPGWPTGWRWRASWWTPR